MTTPLELKVTGMDCGGCETSIQNAVGRIPGVQDVNADHQAGTVRVATEGPVDADAVRAAIVGAGFEVVDA